MDLPGQRLLDADAPRLLAVWLVMSVVGLAVQLTVLARGAKKSDAGDD